MLKHTASLIAAALIAVSLPANAHSPLKTAQPASGSSLETSPDTIKLTFGDAVLLTSVMSMNSTGHSDLTFEPKAKSKEFTITAPNLAAGENTLHWKALSPDGHVVDGTLTYTLTPPTE